MTQFYGSIKIEEVGVIYKLENRPNNKCRRWQFRVYCGINPKTGRYQEKSKRFTGTITEAKKDIVNFANKVKSEKPVSKEHKHITFGQACDKWIKHMLDLHLITNNTAAKNTNYLKSLKHHIEAMPARLVDACLIDNTVKKLMAGDSPSGRSLSGTTINCILNTAQQMCLWAVKEGIMQDNPIADVDRPKNDTDEKQRLTDEQIDTVLNQCTPDDPHYVALMLYLLAGLRKSEPTRMQWLHILFMEGLMHVPGTKTESSDAIEPMTDQLIQFLLAWKENQARQMESNKLKQTDETFILCNGEGKKLTANAIRLWWERNRSDFGCDDITLHQFRHTCVSIFKLAGVHGKDLMNIGRHSDERVSRKTYTHINAAETRKAIKDIKFGIS